MQVMTTTYTDNPETTKQVKLSPTLVVSYFYDEFMVSCSKS